MSHSHYYNFAGDPDLEYHQDYREGQENIWATYAARPGFILACLALSCGFVYQALFLTDHNLLSLPELFWNCLVYLTPTRLLDMIEMYTNPLRISGPASMIPRTHAAKSEAMRSMFGLDRAGSLIGSVAQAGRRRMSTLSGVKFVAAEGSEDSPPGLGNWDNSCYQNSVLQGLASLDSLSGYLTNPHIENEVASKPDMRMVEALRGLIATLNDPTNNGSTKWTPSTLKSMSSWQQQDAQEYFSKVLDEVDKEIGKAASIMRHLKGFEVEGPSSKDSESLRNSTFRNPLEGMVAQRVGCTSCGYSEGLSMIPFNCLTVPLGRRWEYDVSECLDEYTKLEAIEGVECGKCTLLKFQRQLTIILERAKDTPGQESGRLQMSERLKAVNEALEDDDYDDKTLTQKLKIISKNRVSSTKTRQAVIARPPKSLVVHFNRSQFNEITGDLTKNCAAVRFPKVLDLGPWCLGSSGNMRDALAEESESEEWLLQPNQSMIASTRTPSRLWGPLYELRAVVTHYGRHENGHYVCYKKHPGQSQDGDPAKEQWWRLSDEDVMKVSEDQVLGQGGVFMLFFDLIQPAAPASAKDPAKIPLPDVEDFLESDSNTPVRAQEESTATTSASEMDEEEDCSEQAYSPTKPIITSSYLEESVHKDGEGQREISPGSLVMV